MRFHTRLCLLITWFSFLFLITGPLAAVVTQLTIRPASARPDRENRAKETGSGDTAAINHYSSFFKDGCNGVRD